MDKMLRILVVALFICVEVSSQCTLPSGCSKNGGTQVSCTNINEFPTCMPDGYTQLTITNSLSLTSISSIPSVITDLSMNYVGLNSINNTAISDAAGLQSLRISHSADLTSLDMGEPYNPQLQVLYLSNCTSLRTVSTLKKYTRLTSITISYCSLTVIKEEQFEDLKNVKFLDISHNHKLQSIDEDAFEDMDALEFLNMTDCLLSKLYGNYFDDKNFQQVLALRNPYKCLEMCDFMEWYWDHRSFYQISLIGTCTVPTDGTIYVETVYDLNRYWAGCPPIVGIILGATLGAFFFICLAACVFVVVCGIDYRRYCCFCCESQRNRQGAETRNNVNDIEHHNETAYNPNTEKVSLPGPMYTSAPPRYEDLTHELPPETAAIHQPSSSEQ